ncbi:MAG: hypothetical protein QOJ52_3592 [Acidimicrobiaceae bacterium]|nr:hypothetical protein [Acidimicrobiaceae bacterium]MDQ1421630.1 hypothetical protein [Acidimicrobiaceae bacterium]MDQ1440180.1 hypothetical protein [Acidimicrobiaceae bacterium]
MIGRRLLPDRYLEWNERWGAPSGRPVPAWKRRLPASGDRIARQAGPFSFQPNNSTRIWEYPWAFHAVPVTAGMRVVDLGGGLSGLQFVLARSGASVIDVDPFVDYGTPGEYSAVDPAAFLDRLNRLFGTDVALRRSEISDAGLDSASVDVVYCLSTIEHLSAAAVGAALDEIRRVLRPGGHCVLTIDLFLDLTPFTTRLDNRWGTNVDVRALVQASGLDLVYGNPAELAGFAEFDADAVQANLSEYLIGIYPGMAQCLILRKA